MGRVTHCRAVHNSQLRDSTRFQGHPESPTPQTKAGQQPLPGWSTKGPQSLLTLIQTSVPENHDYVVLRQIDVANILGVSPVTIRRRTKNLEDRGLITTRRVNNAIRYELVSNTKQHRADELSHPPDKRSSAIPARADSQTKPRPKCPKHGGSRLSYMSEEISEPVHHCTRPNGDSHCSWLYVDSVGQAREPDLPEWNLKDLTAHLASLRNQPPIVSPPEPVQTRQPTTDPPKKRPTKAQRAWTATSQLIAEKIQDHYIEKYLSGATPNRVQDNVLIVHARTFQAAQWLSIPINQQWSDQAVSTIMETPSSVLYMSPETTQ